MNETMYSLLTITLKKIIKQHANEIIELEKQEKEMIDMILYLSQTLEEEAGCKITTHFEIEEFLKNLK